LSTHKQVADVSVATRKAALFVSFYVPLVTASTLRQRLETLTQTSDAIPDDGHNLASGALVQVVDPPVDNEAKIVRLILSAEGDTVTAWQTMGRELRRILDALDLSLDWWGYTVIYQAVLNEGIDPNSAFNQLLPAIRRVYSADHLRPLAQADLSDGRMWLLAIPERGDGVSAATIYVVLCPPEREQAHTKALLEPSFLMVDLIAHKGYSLKRQYGGGAQQAYGEKLDALWNASDELVGDSDLPRQDSGNGDEVARAYNRVLGDVSKLRRIRGSIARELHDYESWHRQTVRNDIVEYHYGRLKEGDRELDMLVMQGQDALEVVRTVTPRAQTAQADVTQSEEAQAEARRRVVESVLAVAGAALAVPELVNQNAAREFLAWFTFDPGYDNMFVIFLTQFAAIAVVATLLVSVFLFFTGGRMRLAALVGAVVLIAAIVSIPASYHNGRVKVASIKDLIESHYEKAATENYQAAFTDFSSAQQARLGGAQDYAASLQTWCRDVGGDIEEPKVKEIEGNRATTSISVTYHTKCGPVDRLFDTGRRYVWSVVKQGGEWKLDSRKDERLTYTQLPAEVKNGGKKRSDFDGEEDGNLDFIRASNTALPARDACGDTFDYAPSNVVDGHQDTAWTVGGTGVNQWIELKYDKPIRVNRIGIIPGYDKKDRCDGTYRFYQYYVVRRASIEFSDGSAKIVNFEKEPSMRFVNAEDTETTSLHITILDAYPPGDAPGGSSFDYKDSGTIGKAAISEIRVEEN
jgi:hypothetical protein